MFSSRFALPRCKTSFKSLLSFSMKLSGFTKGVDVLAELEGSKKIFVRGYGDYSFQINDVIVGGSVFLLPSTFIMWNCKRMEEITQNSLAIAPLIDPSIEILFVGLGEKPLKRLDSDIIKHYRSFGITIEAMTTKNAASTFNVLNSEGRNVAAALLTLKPADFDTVDITEFNQ